MPFSPKRILQAAKRLDLTGKPVTLYTAGGLIGLAILFGIGVLVLVIVFPFLFIVSAGNAAVGGLGLAVVFPLLLLYGVQVLALVFGGYLLLRGVYRWSSGSIIVSALLSPLIFLLISMDIAAKFGYDTIDVNEPIGVVVLSLFALAPVVTLWIAYNDIRYRRPRINKTNAIHLPAPIATNLQVETTKPAAVQVLLPADSVEDDIVVQSLPPPHASDKSNKKRYSILKVVAAIALLLVAITISVFVSDIVTHRLSDRTLETEGRALMRDVDKAFIVGQHRDEDGRLHHDDLRCHKYSEFFERNRFGCSVQNALDIAPADSRNDERVFRKFYDYLLSAGWSGRAEVDSGSTDIYVDAKSGDEIPYYKDGKDLSINATKELSNGVDCSAHAYLSDDGDAHRILVSCGYVTYDVMTKIYR